MADKHFQRAGEIDLSREVLQLLNNLCMKVEHSDVTFLIEQTKIPAHKFILSTRSEYFRGLFGANFAEATQSEIALKVPLEAFKAVLKFIYTGRITLVGLNVEQIIHVCGLADQYFLESLKQEISSYLARILSLENCASILDVGYLFSLHALQNKCLDFMDTNCSELLKHETFKTLSQKTMCSLLQRDTFNAPEIDIFHAVRDWYKGHPGADVKVVFSGIRWSIMSTNQVLSVLNDKFLDAKYMVELMNVSGKSGNKPCHVARRKNSSTSNDCMPILKDENIASAKYNTKVVKCASNPAALLDVDFATYDFSRGFTYSLIATNVYFGAIIVQLEKVQYANHIRFLLRSDNSREYCYRVDVSLDGKDYKTLIDRTQYFCRSWQDIHFSPRLVQYIKLLGTKSHNENEYSGNYCRFQVFGLEVMYRIDQPNFIDGAIKPSCNVATDEMFAHVIEGAGGNNMLNGNSNEFTCHEIGGFIKVQLSQAYWIDSVGIMLWNDQHWNHSNKYSLYIETSTDNKNWSLAVDKQNELLSSWQRFTFDSRPVVFIKIVGTQQDTNLMCSYFECPSLLKTT